MRWSVRLLAALILTTALLAGTPGSAQAAYYNGYRTIGDTPDVGRAWSVQGFAAGRTYLYSVKISTDNKMAIIYRVNKKTGATTVMKNGTDGGTVNTWLGHANDMTIVGIDGKPYLYVVTYMGSAYQMIKLRYRGATYYRVASYYLRLNGRTLGAGGISVVSKSASRVTFMLRSGRSLFRASVPLRAGTGTTIDAAHVANMSVANAKVNGATVPYLDSFSNQGFLYDAPKNRVYLPLTKGNVSVVLVYRNVTTKSSRQLTAASDLSFRITSAKFKELFEIEGVGVSGGRLYFNTNRRSNGRAYDGVHVFARFRA